MCWHNYTTGARCFIWSARRCPEACCCVLSLGIQFFGMLQSSSKLVRVFLGLLQFFSSRVRVFSGCNKVSRGVRMILSRDTTKSLAARSCFSSGLLQSNSLCVRAFSRAFTKFLVVHMCFLFRAAANFFVVRFCLKFLVVRVRFFSGLLQMSVAMLACF